MNNKYNHHSLFLTLSNTFSLLFFLSVIIIIGALCGSLRAWAWSVWCRMCVIIQSVGNEGIEKVDTYLLLIALIPWYLDVKKRHKNEKHVQPCYATRMAM